MERQLQLLLQQQRWRKRKRRGQGGACLFRREEQTKKKQQQEQEEEVEREEARSQRQQPPAVSSAWARAPRAAWRCRLPFFMSLRWRRRCEKGSEPRRRRAKKKNRSGGSKKKITTLTSAENQPSQLFSLLLEGTSLKPLCRAIFRRFEVSHGLSVRPAERARACAREMEKGGSVVEKSAAIAAAADGATRSFRSPSASSSSDCDPLFVGMTLTLRRS